jgi:nitronate monooxygenase
MIIAGTMDDLIVSNAFTGAYASWLRPSIVKAGHDPAALKPRVGYQFKGQLGDEPKPWKGIFSAGQGIDMIDRQESVAEIVSALKADYARLIGR